MFRALFQHISTNDIPMTSPVDMTYGTGGSDRMSGMAFLYRTPELGPVGTDGVVRVEDVPPRAYASTGMRGSYSDAHHREGLGRVEAWIAAQPGWKADGPSRYLGYNSPSCHGSCATASAGAGDSRVTTSDDQRPVNVGFSTTVERSNRLN